MFSRSLKFNHSVVSDVGIKRTQNQDSYSFAHSKHVSLYVVADGMGGMKGGEVASEIAARVVVQEAFDEDGFITKESLKRAIEQANLSIFLKSVKSTELKGMGTTVAAIAFVGNKAIISHVGDSRIYHLSEEKLKQVSKDHTLVQELIDGGNIDKSEAKTHPIAHMLTRSLGPLEKVEVEAGFLEEDVKDGQRFLICSDGLYNHVSDEELEKIMLKEDPEQACKTLLDLALERGGTDNITIQIVEVDLEASLELPDTGMCKCNLHGEDHSWSLVDRGISENLNSKSNSKTQEFKRQQFSFFPVIATLVPVALISFLYFGNNKKDKEIFSLKNNKIVDAKTVKSEVVLSESSKPQEVITTAVSKPVVPSEPAKVEVKKEISKEKVKKNEPKQLIQKKSKYAESIFKEANSIKVAAVPSVSLEAEPVDQPIVWQKEESKFLKLTKEKKVKLGEKTNFDIDYWSDYVDTLASKKQIRNEIAEIDFKLKLFEKSSETKEQIISKIHKAKIVQETELANFNRMLDLHERLLDTSGIKDSKSLLEYLEGNKSNSGMLANLLSNYTEVETQYKEAVKVWQDNPRELDLAAKMGAKSQEKDELLKKIHQDVHSIAEKKGSDDLDNIAKKKLELENIENLINTSNKRLGFIDAHTKLSAKREDQIKKRYLDERKKKLTELEKLSKELPDAYEKNVQIKSINSELAKVLKN